MIEYLWLLARYTLIGMIALFIFMLGAAINSRSWGEDYETFRRAYTMEGPAWTVYNGENRAVLLGVVTKVADGDTISVGPLRVRFSGISAEELDMPLGMQGKEFMERTVLGKMVTCTLTGKVNHDRVIGDCFVRSETVDSVWIDLQKAIVARGLARDCPRFSGGKYKRFEDPEAVKDMWLPPYCEVK